MTFSDESYEAKVKELKLKLLTSLLDSQAAINRMLCSTAECYVHSGERYDKRLQQELVMLCKLQHQLLEKLSFVNERTRKQGTPAQPWINQDLRRMQAPALFQVKLPSKP